MMTLRYFVFLIVLSAACACDSNDLEAEPVAQVGDYKLTKDEIVAVLGSAATPEEMEGFAHEWVQNVRTELLIKNKLKRNPKDIAVKVREYEQSLYLYAYEQQEISKRLDTLITDAEIERYYTENQGEFKLEDYLVEVFFARIERGDKSVNDLEQWYRYSDSTNLAKAAEIASLHADPFVWSKGNWMYFEEVERMLPPASLYHRTSFITGKAKQRFADENFWYFVNVINFRSGISPLEFEIPNIRERILQHRISELRRQIRQEIQNEISNEPVEINL